MTLAVSRRNLNEAEKQIVYNRLVKMGLNDSATEEDLRWRRGDYAAEICTLWSSDAPLIAYGRDINLSSPKRIYEFHTTSMIFPPSAREEIKEDLAGIYWSHCRAAALHAAKIGASRDVAMSWLQRANDNHWTVNMFTKQLKDIDNEWAQHRAYLPSEIESVYLPEEGKTGTVTLRMDRKQIERLRDIMQQRNLCADLRATYELPVLKDEPTSKPEVK